jgi:membrane protein implicated in regulation of membrane protease activity
MEDASGWMFVTISIIFVAVLAVALSYATVKWRRRRSRGMQQIRDEKTRELYGKR